MKTFSAKTHEIMRKWFVIDAKDMILGRVASEAARYLRGKHKPEFTVHVDCGDFIVITNASHIAVTGNKLKDKKYYRYSGYPGGVKEVSLDVMQKKFPCRVLEKAIRGMLPRGPLGNAIFKKLKIYATDAHPHVSQKLEPLSIKV